MRRFADAEPVRLAVIGLGHQAQSEHLPAISQVPALELVAGADPDLNAREWLEAAYGVPTFADEESMFASGIAIDCVLVAVPHFLHLPVCRLALSNGVAVLKEKPYALSVEQGMALRELERQYDLPIETFVKRRNHYAYQVFDELLPLIGDIGHVALTYELSIPEPLAGWRGVPEQAGGGCILDMGYHMIDLVIWYFGLPEEVSAVTFCDRHCAACDHPEVAAQVNFSYDGGATTGTLMMSRVAPLKREVVVAAGSDGRLDLVDGVLTHRPTSGRARSYGGAWSWEVAAIEHLHEFANKLRGHAVPVTPHVDHLAFIEAAYRSITTGRHIRPAELLVKATA